MPATAPTESATARACEKPVLFLISRRPNGQVAQVVEQGTENPRVGGSTPSLTTSR